MSPAKRRRTRVTGAFPGRKPGMRAIRAMSRATLSVAFCTFSAGISRSISRLQVASVIGTVLREEKWLATRFQSAFRLFGNRQGGTQERAAKGRTAKVEYREIAPARQ